MNTREISTSGELLLLLITICCASILSYIYMLEAWSVPMETVLFWIPLVIASGAVIYAALTMKSRYSLFLSLLFCITIHLMPIVRQPSGMAWNTNAPYDLQIIEHVLSTGHWTFGYGTEAAVEFSYEPPMYILFAFFSMLTGVSTMEVEKFLLAFVNPVVLLSLYVFARKLGASLRLSNIAVAFFTTNPLFQGLQSYAHAESYAFIFFPLSLSYLVLRDDRRMSAIGLLLLILIAISHPFTSYMLAFSVVAAYVAQRIARLPHISESIVTLALAIPAAWLGLLAIFLLRTHVTYLEDIILSFGMAFRPVGYFQAGSAMWYPNELARDISAARDGILVLLTLIGLLEFVSKWTAIPRPRWKKALGYYASHYRQLLATRAKASLTMLLLCFSALAALSLFFVQWGPGGATQTFSDIRERVTEFLFVPLSVFCALALKSICGHRLSGKFAAIVIIALVMMPAAIVNAFPRQVYNQGYVAVNSDEWSLHPQKKYALGIWVRNSAPLTLKHSFTGSLSMYYYIRGYGLQQSWELDLITYPAARAFACDYSSILLFYVADQTNTHVPDSLGRTLDENTLVSLSLTASRVYDSGDVSIHIIPVCTG